MDISVAMTRRRERYGWSILFLVAIFALVVGLRLLFTGAPANPMVVIQLTGRSWQELQGTQPGISRLASIVARHEGLALTGWSIWLLSSSIRGYRLGERWLWFAWWTVPAFVLGLRLTGAHAGGTLEFVLSGVGFLALLGLILARPRAAQ